MAIGVEEGVTRSSFCPKFRTLDQGWVVKNTTRVTRVKSRVKSRVKHTSKIKKHTKNTAAERVTFQSDGLGSGDLGVDESEMSDCECGVFEYRVFE